MVPLYPLQQPFGLTRLAPLARHKLVALAQRGVDVDSSQYLAQAEAVLHSQHELIDQLRGMVAHNGGAENTVATRFGQHLDKTVCLTISDGATANIQAGYINLAGGTGTVSVTGTGGAAT